MPRTLEPEWLDVLPSSDARAQRSRRDLRRINLLMGNARHIARELRASRPMRIADLGAGDGELARRVLRGSDAAEVILVDRALDALPPGWTKGAVVAKADVFDFLLRPGARFDAIVANLFLHHFEREPLRRLLSLIAQRTGLFVACEPRRSRVALSASRLLGLIGCNDVTRHDALVSVRAGFRGEELSELWPREPGWRLAERAARPFSHLFVARRDDAL
jgi:SAM-dependent methyltransferase